MGVPKKRHSDKRRGDRRAKTGVEAMALISCAKCGASVLPHHMCGECWTYNGVSLSKEAIETEAASPATKAAKTVAKA